MIQQGPKPTQSSPKTANAVRVSTRGRDGSENLTVPAALIIGSDLTRKSEHRGIVSGLALGCGTLRGAEGVS